MIHVGHGGTEDGKEGTTDYTDFTETADRRGTMKYTKNKCVAQLVKRATEARRTARRKRRTIHWDEIAASAWRRTRNDCALQSVHALCGISKSTTFS